MNQKKDIKRQKERLEQLKREAEEETQRALEAARERVLRDFEKGQLGSSANLPATVSTSGVESTKERAWFCVTHFLILQRALRRSHEQTETRFRQFNRGDAHTGG